jgi:hypothetical protein
MGRTKLERETIVVYNDGENEAQLWTASPVQAQRWKRLGLILTTKGGGWWAAVPKRCVRVRSPLMKRVLSEKHKAALLRHRLTGRRGESANN